MEIYIPENIDLSHAEQYTFVLEVYPERFAFFLYRAGDDTPAFYSPVPDGKVVGAIAAFQEAFFDNTFFALPFRQTIVMNYTPVFTFVPNSLFEEKDKAHYLHFLFSAVKGKILSQTLQKPELTIVHEMPEDVYGFIQRSFPDARIIHPTAAYMAYLQPGEQTVDGNRMLVNKRGKGLDILCCSREKVLLSNHFECQRPEDAVYYILYVWKQLKFDQLSDYLFLAGDTDDIVEQLRAYLQIIQPALLNYEL